MQVAYSEPWDKAFLPLIEAVADPDYIAASNMAAHIQGRRMGALTARDRAGRIKCLVVYTRVRQAHGFELCIELVNGKADRSGSWTQKLWPHVEHVARLNGCGRVAAPVERPGMARLLEGVGCRPLSQIYVKDI